MARVVRILVVLLMLALASGISLADIVGVDDCGQNCDESTGGKTCPPACAGCPCSMRIATPATDRTTALAIVPVVSRVQSAPPTSQPLSPDPREILHVPRPHVV